MRSHKSEMSSWSVRGLYLFAFLLVFWPLADLVTNTLPFQIGSVRWRYGFGGLMAGFLHTPILGLVLATLVAFWHRSRATLRALGFLELLASILLVVVMVTFALDALQLRGTRPPESLPSFTAGAIIAEAKHCTAFLALLLLGVGSWRTAAKMQPARSAASATGGLMASSARAQARS